MESSHPQTPNAWAHTSNINTNNIDTPAPPETPWAPETPWQGAPGEEPRWFEKEETIRRRHPYEHKLSAVQSVSRPRMKATDVAFWPWVGPRKPGRAPPGIDWEEYARMVVIAFPNCVVVGRVSDTSKPWEPLWSYACPEDTLFQAAWTYDLYTRHPLVLCAGINGILYMLDAMTQQCIRTFRGHGNDILCISVCKSHPYLVATTSTDKSIRIWNLLGAPPPDIPPSERSENYPMGDADEGTECFAILPGEGFGHKAKVITCAFHPRHAALVTGGADTAVKVWALPKFPLPDASFVTPRGYRPHVVHCPVFSTSRINDTLVDWVEWVGPDVIVARDLDCLQLFHWIGYKRFFHPSRFYALSRDVQYHDMHESHSWSDLVRYPVPGLSARWYIKPAIHYGFQPTAEEEDDFEDNHNLVYGCLLAMPVESRYPEIHLFNPSLYRDDPPQLPYRALRPKTPAGEWEPLPEDVVPEETEAEADEAESEPDFEIIERDVYMALQKGSSSTIVQVDLTATVLGAGTGSVSPEGELSTVNRVKLHPRASAAKESRGEKSKRRKEQSEAKEVAKMEKYGNKSMMPWILAAKDWPTVKKMSPAFKWVSVEKSVIQAVAISPRGAKWIVGVGDLGGVFVFRQKDRAS